MKLKFKMLIGQRFFTPKLDWEYMGGFWRAKPEGALHSYEVKRVELETKKGSFAWYLHINSLIANEKINKKGMIKVAMVHSSTAAIAIAELLEARENESSPFKYNGVKNVFVGEEMWVINDAKWEVKGNSYLYFHGLLFLCRLTKPRGAEFWELNIMRLNEALELGGIDSLEIGQAIVALIDV